MLRDFSPSMLSATVDGSSLSTGFPQLWQKQFAGFGKQQTQVVGNFGGGSNRAAIRFGSACTGDCDRGRDAQDLIAIGFVQPLQELSRVSGKAFDVTSLAFCIQCIEREGRLAATGQTADRDQFASRDIDIDILQVVDAAPANRNDVGFQRSTLTCPSADERHLVPSPRNRFSARRLPKKWELRL